MKEGCLRIKDSLGKYSLQDMNTLEVRNSTQGRHLNISVCLACYLSLFYPVEEASCNAAASFTDSYHPLTQLPAPLSGKAP